MDDKHLCTYGEAHIAVKMNMSLVHGKWVSIPKPAHKPQMSKRDAGIYYNAKLNKFWHTMLEDEMPSKEKREKIIKAICTNLIIYRQFCFKMKRANNEHKTQSI